MAKAVTAARAINARPHPQWYDQWQPHHEVRHDLVLPLANGREVRTLIAQRGEPLLLHATTSPNWTAELHRHRPDHDDCPSCRIPDMTTPQMDCSTGPAAPEEPDSPDAALPFLSAGAGLLLAAALAELPAGTVLEHRKNHWQLDLTLAGHLLRPLRHPPRDGCRHIQLRPVRQAFQSSHRDAGTTSTGPASSVKPPLSGELTSLTAMNVNRERLRLGTSVTKRSRYAPCGVRIVRA